MTRIEIEFSIYTMVLEFDRGRVKWSGDSDRLRSILERRTPDLLNSIPVSIPDAAMGLALQACEAYGGKITKVEGQEKPPTGTDAPGIVY